MGITNAHHHLLLTLTVTLAIFSPAAVAGDIYNLIYKGCANQTFSGGGAAASGQSLAALASSLISQSSTTKFFKTTTSGSGQSLFGLFQCRGDLSPSSCAACIARALPLWTSLCGSAVAARVQLSGCYALYQISGFPQVAGTQLLFKTCGSGGNAGGDFEVKRDTAFQQLETGIGGGQGFYVTSFGSVYTMAQCEGDLSAGDCSECVSQAVQKSEVECGGAASGQVYLDKCYISYSYYANGVSRGGSGGGGSGGQTSKTVAIVVGGAAGVGFLVICLLFARGLFKKKDDF